MQIIEHFTTQSLCNEVIKISAKIVKIYGASVTENARLSSSIFECDRRRRPTPLVVGGYGQEFAVLFSDSRSRRDSFSVSRLSRDGCDMELKIVGDELNGGDVS